MLRKLLTKRSLVSGILRNNPKFPYSQKQTEVQNITLDLRKLFYEAFSGSLKSKTGDFEIPFGKERALSECNCLKKSERVKGEVIKGEM